MRWTTFAVGTIVSIKTPGDLLGNAPGSVGICYDEYEGGSSFIFENGNYDGFSTSEQDMMLNYVGEDDELSHYEFKNVMKVSDDFRQGVFDFKRIKKNL